MKIFISHSSKDKWAARRISDDLIALGSETFLDEKDIETGQSIDVSIRKHLKECEDFLIILSPASIKSEWVLIELGGALALEKKIVPILLYVGANEIPQVINLKLARDINSVHLYYEELKLKISGKKVTSRATQKIVIKSTFRVGDKVLVVPKRPKNIMRNDSLIDWEPEMDRYLGQETKIRQVYSQPTESYSLEIDKLIPDEYFVFAKEWLIPIK